MSAQHTPAPWVVVQASWDEDTCDVRYTLEGVKVARVADARLIAAAPEMLEVLEEIARMPVARMYPDGPCLEHHDMNSVRAAIAKAKGETK